MTDERPVRHRAIGDLQESGLLWLINRVVFHPRGFALAIAKRQPDGEFLAWVLLGDGTEPWSFDDDGDYLARVNALLAPAVTEGGQ